MLERGHRESIELRIVSLLKRGTNPNQMVVQNRIHFVPLFLSNSTHHCDPTLCSDHIRLTLELLLRFVLVGLQSLLLLDFALLFFLHQNESITGRVLILTTKRLSKLVERQYYKKHGKQLAKAPRRPNPSAIISTQS